ncbi:hypothetical protein AB836_00380 [Rickettsiales bacterium (ex Bugula neritina AB1)]|nr:hypothetical protein AB836_00380 [Rickettsiales bacterium (ex Bugula neritina AB1)]
MKIYFNDNLLPSEMSGKVSIKFNKKTEILRDIYNNIISKDEKYLITIESISEIIPIFIRDKRGEKFSFYFNNHDMYFFSSITSEYEIIPLNLTFHTILLDFSFTISDTYVVKWKMILEEY